MTLRWSRALDRLVALALAEDVGAGDVTTERIVPKAMMGGGQLFAKARGVFCGAPVAERVFRRASPRISIRWTVEEGEEVFPGELVAEMTGPYRGLLVGERTALNFLQRLSGIATLTRRMVEAASGGKGQKGPEICDTRKTTPLWRALERYAVRAGGGTNHRFGLFDMVLIKENHMRAAGSLAEAIRRAKQGRKQTRVAAEARGADEVRQACRHGVDLILLDNMTPAQARSIVREFGGSRIAFEISGGVTLANVRAYARSGAERISVGALTHSAPALDLSLQLYPTGGMRTARR